MTRSSVVHLELLFSMLSSGFRLSKLDLSELVSLGFYCCLYVKCAQGVSAGLDIRWLC